MKKREDGFLSSENIDYDGEVMDYIKELHNYLWEYIHCILPNASGRLDWYIDSALKELKQKKSANKKNNQRSVNNYQLT